MPLAPGARLGPYEILSAIGAGGMSEMSLGVTFASFLATAEPVQKDDDARDEGDAPQQQQRILHR